MSQLDRFRRLLGMNQPNDRRNARRLLARKGLRVLVVDDSTTASAALSYMLGQNGYETESASSAEEAMEIARSNPPELLFLDIVLPGMSGFSALRSFRKMPETAEVPVVLISGNQEAIERLYLERIGADDFIRKPFGRAEVFDSIQGLVESGRLPGRTRRSEEAVPEAVDSAEVEDESVSVPADDSSRDPPAP